MNPVDPMVKKFEDTNEYYNKTCRSKYECHSIILGDDFFGSQIKIF
jgi:hypothetical protein